MLFATPFPIVPNPSTFEFLRPLCQRVYAVQLPHSWHWQFWAFNVNTFSWNVSKVSAEYCPLTLSRVVDDAIEHADNESLFCLGLLFFQVSPEQWKNYCPWLTNNGLTQKHHPSGLFLSCQKWRSGFFSRVGTSDIKIGLANRENGGHQDELIMAYVQPPLTNID